MSARLPPRLRAFFRHPPRSVKTALLILAVVSYATAGFMYFELDAKPELLWQDAFWWAMVTMTTVGFGDYFPVTMAGRFLVGIPTMLIGIGMLGYGLSFLAGFFIRAESFNRRGLSMQKLSDHVLICNFPSKRRVMQIVTELRGTQAFAHSPVALIDEQLDELDSDLSRMDVHFVKGHPAREETLRRANIAEAARAIVLARDPVHASSDDLSVTIALSLRHLRPALHLVAECVGPANEELLKRAGCHSVVCVMGLAPGILVQELQAPGVMRVLTELAQSSDQAHNIFMVPILTSDGKARAVTDLKRWAERENVTLLGLRHEAGVTINPGGAMVVRSGHEAIVVCRVRPERVAL